MHCPSFVCIYFVEKFIMIILMLLYVSDMIKKFNRVFSKFQFKEMINLVLVSIYELILMEDCR